LVRSVAVIGAGVIGGAIVKCLLESNEAPKIIATRRNIDQLKPFEELGVKVTSENVQAVREAEVVFICVKPGDVEGVLREIEPEVSGKLVISTAAIIPLEFFKRLAPEARYVRTMPNVAALAQESFTAYSLGPDITEEDHETAVRLLDTMGISMEVEEKYMDAITGLSGSGPAYVAIILDALMYAGLKVGLPRNLAKYSAAQSVMGAAKLILDDILTPAEIAEMVTTPGGTTIEGIYEIEDGKLRTALMNAVEAATNKCINIRYKWENANNS
jgi:pyrroline-5-carboxylate reductase